MAVIRRGDGGDGPVVSLLEYLLDPYDDPRGGDL